MSEITTPRTGTQGIVDSYRALASPSPHQQTDPAKSKAIGLLVMAMSTHFYKDDVSAEQVAMKTIDFINDLTEFTILEISSAFTAYRNDPASKKFPTPGQIKQLCFRERSDRHAATRPKLSGKSRPCMWWHIPKERWRLYDGNWSETEVPAGQLIRDVAGGPLREPIR